MDSYNNTLLCGWFLVLSALVLSGLFGSLLGAVFALSSVGFSYFLSNSQATGFLEEYQAEFSYGMIACTAFAHIAWVFAAIM
ncbi:hypothetical protein ABIE65_002036 [Constrictibacter sp. MBR-5]|jgi:hypothetical protein